MTPIASQSHKPMVGSGDRIFAGLSRAAAIIVVAILGAVGFFLLWQSIPAFTATPGQASLLSGNFIAYASPLLFGTLWAAFLALLFSLPLAIAVALFLTNYAPARLRTPLGFTVDLLAAVPSVVYGLWGIAVLAPALRPVYVWLNQKLGWFPLFGGTVSGTGRTILTAGLVLAVMILPLMTALIREVFLQSPVTVREGALALGATRWEMIRLAVLPPAKGPIVSAAMLGLGRALGETMAVAMVLSATGTVTLDLLTSENPSTIAANIALSFPEAFGRNINVLIATGLILFVTTFAVNALARKLLAKERKQ